MPMQNNKKQNRTANIQNKTDTAQKLKKQNRGQNDMETAREMGAKRNTIVKQKNKR
jgi:hypothetical protein